MVALVPRPEVVLTSLAAFESLADSCRAVARIIREGVRPAALEILDRLTIEAVEASAFRAGYPASAGAVLLIEQEGLPREIELERELIRAACEGESALSFESATDPVRSGMPRGLAS